MKKFDFTREPGKTRKTGWHPEKSEARISVITGYYNAGKYFEETFNSVHNQTFPWFEWIIVNDGSTKPEDVELLHRLAATDSRVQVIDQANGGLSAARNAAWQAATTDLIVPVDADDLIEPQYLQVLWFAIQEHPEAAWAYTDNVGFQEQEYTWHKPFSAERLKTENFLTYSAVIRKKDLEEVGGYIVESQLYNEDWRTWLNLLSAHKKPVHLSGELFWYRRLSSGMLSDLNTNPEKKAFCEKIISEAAKTVDTTVQAVEYPAVDGGEEFEIPARLHADLVLPATPGKKRVMFLFPWFEMGGADQFNLDLLRMLPTEQYEISILTTLPGENPWRQRFTEYTDEVYCLADFLEPGRYAAFLSWYIESRNIDLLMVSNSYYGYYLLPWLRKEFPTLAIMDYVHMEEWYYRNGGFARTSAALGGVLEYTGVCNGKTQRVLTQQLGRAADTVETVYIGVDTHKYDPAKVEPGAAYRALGIEKNRPIVLFPCRMHPQKRPFLMLHLAGLLKKQGKNFAFAVVGDGPQLDQMQAYVEENQLSDTVFFAGAQKDMRPWYKDAAVTLICSINEGLSLTAYESASMGVPIITSDVGGQRELVDASIGRVVPMLQSQAKDLDARSWPEEEVEGYLAAFESLFAGPDAYQKVRAACRKRVLEGFSLELMAKRMDEIFTRLLEDPMLSAKRQQTARLLAEQPALAADYLSLYVEYERQQRRMDEVWKTKCWLDGEYLAQKAKIEDMAGWIDHQDVVVNSLSARLAAAEATAAGVEAQKQDFEARLAAQEQDFEARLAQENAAQAELARIYAMRSWKLVNFYHRLRGQGR